jgi:hypothetical protein
MKHFGFLGLDVSVEGRRSLILLILPSFFTRGNTYFFTIYSIFWFHHFLHLVVSENSLKRKRDEERGRERKKEKERERERKKESEREGGV